VRIQEVGWPARAAGAEQMPEDWHWRGEAVPEGHRWVRIVLKEGRKRQIRLMLEALGSEAVRLIRVRMGALTLDELKPGRGRWLRPVEVRLLRRSAELPDIELS
jgi:pseudouridine synthase